VLWTDQLVPFHVSARFLNSLLVVSQFPTAVQEVSVAQETPRKKLSRLPEGLGVLCRVQVEPLKL
jgi:hypothetical protein